MKWNICGYDKYLYHNILMYCYLAFKLSILLSSINLLNEILYLKQMLIYN